MQPARWTAAAAVAVLLAAVPGVAALPSPRAGLDRAITPVHRTEVAVGPVASEPTVLDAVTEPELEPAATPIVPPSAELTGPLAPAEPPPPSYDETVGEGEVFALTVGIDDYPGTSADLRYAVRDAQAIDAALDGFGVPPGNRMLLRDGQARREPLVAAIEALVARARPGTKVVLAVAGHVRSLGGGTEAIVTADGALLTDTELAALLAPAAADQMWILLATCFAGGFTEVLAPGRVLTGAADARSLAYESSAVGGSFLVHHLVREGWFEGRAGPTVQEAFAYAEAAMAGTAGEGAVMVDQGDRPLSFGPLADHWRPNSAPALGAASSPAPGVAAPPPAPPATHSTTTTRPSPGLEAPAPPPPGRRESGGRCTLLVLCRSR